MLDDRPGACSSRPHKHPDPAAPSATTATAATRIAFRLAFLLMLIASTPQFFSPAQARPPILWRQAQQPER
ncbi:hypothetical protein BE20_04235 [Sorangium cellulosum]|nr:hypothetical protein BE20_04235 [Sorangium cellulosum]